MSAIQSGMDPYAQYNQPMGAGAGFPQPVSGGFANTQSGFTAPYTNTTSAWPSPTPAASPLNVDYSRPFGPAATAGPMGGQILGAYPNNNVAPIQAPATANWGVAPNYGVPATADLYSAQATAAPLPGFDMSALSAQPAAMSNSSPLGATTPASIPAMPQATGMPVAFGGGGCCSAQDDGTHAHGQLNLVA